MTAHLFRDAIAKPGLCSPRQVSLRGPVTNYGEAGRGGGASEVLPMRKGGGDKAFAIPTSLLEFWGSFYAESLAILKERGEGRRKFYSILRGGGYKKFQICKVPNL